MHAFHVAIAAVNTGLAAYMSTGGLANRRATALTLPYVATALAHWAASRARGYGAARLRVVLAFEAAYALICALSMPHWVLAAPTSGRTHLRSFALGSGVLISVWCAPRRVRPRGGAIGAGGGRKRRRHGTRARAQ